jgi:hypothetical protein
MEAKDTPHEYRLRRNPDSVEWTTDSPKFFSEEFKGTLQECEAEMDRLDRGRVAKFMAKYPSFDTIDLWVDWRDALKPGLQSITFSWSLPYAREKVTSDFDTFERGLATQEEWRIGMSVSQWSNVLKKCDTLITEGRLHLVHDSINSWFTMKSGDIQALLTDPPSAGTPLTPSQGRCLYRIVEDCVRGCPYHIISFKPHTVVKGFPELDDQLPL